MNICNKWLGINISTQKNKKIDEKHLATMSYILMLYQKFYKYFVQILLISFYSVDTVHCTTQVLLMIRVLRFYVSAFACVFVLSLKNHG